MRKKKEEIECFVGSGNVFKDLGHPNPEEARAKAHLALQIQKTIKRRKLTQAQAAKLMGIDQPKVSDIVRGKLSRYSIERLMRFLGLLGKDIEIRIKPQRKRRDHTWISVVEDKPPRRRTSI